MTYTLEEYHALPEEEQARVARAILENLGPRTEDEEEIVKDRFGENFSILDYLVGYGKYTELLEGVAEGCFYSKWALVDFTRSSEAEMYADKSKLDKLHYKTLYDLAKSGKIPSYVMLGDAILKGIGCKQNTEEAIHWYNKAIVSGDKVGNERIGDIYYFGEFKPQDYKKAFKYYTKNKGEKTDSTLYHMAEMYRKGLYVGKDLAEAYRYYSAIVYDNRGDLINNTFGKDEHFWRACYRVAYANHYGEGTDINLDKALEVLCKAMLIHGEIIENSSEDITWEEMKQEWFSLNKEAGWF